MPTINEQRKTIIKYSNNLIKVKIWEFLAHKKGEITDSKIKQTIQEQLEITPRQLTAYLDNFSQPTIQQFFEIAQVLECTVNDLIEGGK